MNVALTGVRLIIQTMAVCRIERKGGPHPKGSGVAGTVCTQFLWEGLGCLLLGTEFQDDSDILCYFLLD